jgi:diaminopimelate epimerase
MQLKFVKAHGLGNDFMMVEWPAGLPGPDPALVRRWADRRLGIGFDSLLALDAAPAPDGTRRYRVFNADGGEVEQCGNGARCLASFLADGRRGDLTLATADRRVETRVLDDGYVAVNLGVPDFRPAALPFRADSEAHRYTRATSLGPIEFGAVSMGNPHVVCRVDSVEAAPVGILGPELQTHPDFPRGVNVGFMEYLDEEHVRLRVYERGVGETRACGTGAAAAVAVGRLWGLLHEQVAVALPGGTLTVRWSGRGAPLWQTGPTQRVYEGCIEV